MPKYRVKKGYCLIDGGIKYPPGTVLSLTEAFAALQLWKLDKIGEDEPKEEIKIEPEGEKANEKEEQKPKEEAVKEARERAKKARAEARKKEKLDTGPTLREIDE